MQKYWSIFVVLDLLSAAILGLGLNGILPGIILVMLSLPMVRVTSSILPMMFIASWSSSMAIFGFSAFYYYFFLMILSVIINPNKVRWNFKENIKLTVLLSLFVMWMILSAFLSVSGEIFNPVKICLYILFPILASVCCISDMGLCYRSLIVISLYFSVYFLFRGVVAPIEMYNVERMMVDKTLIYGIGTNPMAQAIVVMLIYSFAVSMRLKSKELLLLSMLFFFSLFYLGSRTSAYTSIVFIGIYFLFGVRLNTRSKILLCVIGFATVLLFLTLGSFFENFERLNVSSIQEDQGSGRFVNWAIYLLDIIPYHLFTGIGPSIKNYEALGYLYDADNMYIDLLCELGVPGLLLFIVLYVATIKAANRIPASFYKGLFLILLLSFLSIGMGETVFDTSLFWFIVGLMLLALNSELYKRSRTVYM